MLKMRLQRVGRKNDPSYRLVVTDSRTGPKSGKHVDYLGSYDPKSNRVEIKADRAKDWLSKGVQPSPTVHNILVGQKIIEGKKVNVLPRKSPVVNEEAEKAKAEAAAAAEAKEAEVVEETPDAATEEAAPAPEAEETPEPEEAPAAEEEKAA